MRICSSCQCPAPTTATACAFCGASYTAPSAVTFSIERSKDGFAWLTTGTLVASATMVEGSWRLSDARNDHVVTLVPLSDDDGLALVGPEAALIGAIRRDQQGPAAMVAAVATDPDGDTVLVLRTDGEHAAHVVDSEGDVVALASWENEVATTDLLVTPLGTRHSLAMVFGLLLSLELTRRVDTV